MVLFLLSVRFGSSFVESTTSSTVLNNETQPTPRSNISNIETSTTSAMLNSASVAGNPAQNPSRQVMNSMNEEVHEELSALVQELKGKITKETDPTNPNPSDVNVIKTLTETIDKGMAFLRKYNNSGNFTVDIFNVTESLVVMINKYDCLRDRRVRLPDRSNDFIAEALEKFTDDIELTFQCPRIVKNETRSVAASSRKRREVENAVTVDLAKANPKEDEDFHEFQMLYHHTRYRRDAATQDCGQPACEFKRFETNLTITNRTFGDSLKDESSSDYKMLTEQLQDTLNAKVAESQNAWFQDVNTFKYHRVNVHDVKATFYLDVRPDTSEETVIEALKDNLLSGRLGDFEVNDKTISLHRIVGLERIRVHHESLIEHLFQSIISNPSTK